MSTYHPMEIPAQVLLDIMQNRRYGVEYQPVVNARNGTVHGYEALARFYTAEGKPVPPGAVFRTLHQTPLNLYQVEYEVKKLQIAHAPKNCLLFLNIDPDAYGAYGAYGDEATQHPYTQLLTNLPHVVVEVIENTGASDVYISDAMVQNFKAHGITLALDDIGASATLISLPVLMAVDYLKFDRLWLQHRETPAHLALLKGLIHYASQTGKKTILEGVEANNDLIWARNLGIDYVQGFLYKRLFRNTTSRNVRQPHALVGAEGRKSIALLKNQCGIVPHAMPPRGAKAPKLSLVPTEEA